MGNQDKLDFDILGYGVKISPDKLGTKELERYEEIIDRVRQLAQEISKTKPSLNSSEVFLSVALKLAESIDSKDQDFKKQVRSFESSASHILSLIEKVTPPVDSQALS